MKKTLIALGLAIAMTQTAFAGGHKLTMGTEGAYAPYNFIDEDGEIAGFEIELGNDLCRRMNKKCTWVTNEWDTIIPNLTAGNYDSIMAGMSITEERQKTINFTDEYYPPEPSRFLAYTGTWVNPNGMAGKIIGVQGGTIQAAHAEQHWSAKNTIKSYETGEQSLADLAAGAVDYVFADGGFLAPAEKASSGMLSLTGPDIYIGGGIGIGLRKTDRKLLGQFNQAIRSAKADGTVDRLLRKYFKIGSFYQ